MDHNLFSLPNCDSHVYTQPETGSKPVMPSAAVYQEAEAPNAGSQAGGVCDCLGILFLWALSAGTSQDCSACLICRTAVLAGCVGQEPVRESPWQGAPRCRVTNVATARFLLSCKKFTWSLFIWGVILLRMPAWLGMVLTAD